jgi:hypothetical protein
MQDAYFSRAIKRLKRAAPFAHWRFRIYLLYSNRALFAFDYGLEVWVLGKSVK